MKIQPIDSLKEIAVKSRKDILRILHSGKASHLGSSMSIVEMLTAIYSMCDIQAIQDWVLDRDRVIVSKGHAAAATYSVMHQFGLIKTEELNTYHQSGSHLQGHVSHGVQFVEHSTGALGHGLSVGVGHAYFLKSKGSNKKVFVICGDGEIQEGSIWEAVMLAVTKGLGNLIILVDANGISSFQATSDVISAGDLSKRFEGFGAAVCSVDGHKIEEIQKAISDFGSETKPLVVICHTTKGKGVSFAENQAIWHYRSLSDELLDTAMSEQQ